MQKPKIFHILGIHIYHDFKKRKFPAILKFIFRDFLLRFIQYSEVVYPLTNTKFFLCKLKKIVRLQQLIFNQKF